MQGALLPDCSVVVTLGGPATASELNIFSASVLCRLRGSALSADYTPSLPAACSERVRVQPSTTITGESRNRDVD